METEIDSENYRGKEDYGFKEICLAQVRKCARVGSSEFRAGYWIYSTVAGTNQKVRYVGDSRKEYIQGIEVLHDLLLPKFDKKMKEYSTQHDKDSETLRKKRTGLIQKAGGDDENYATIKLKLFRKMFQELCMFLERLGWLESAQITDE